MVDRSGTANRHRVLALVVGVAAVLGAGSATVGAQGGKGTLTGEDYAEIQRLYYMYNYAFDTNDGEAYAAVFTEDGEFVVSGGQAMAGRDEIAALAASRGEPRERPKIFHVTTNIIIHPSPEGATGSAYVVLVDLAADTVISGGGVYEDELVKTAEGWRFKKRSFFSE